MLSFECIKNEKSVYFLLTSAEWEFVGLIWAYGAGISSKVQKES